LKNFKITEINEESLQSPKTLFEVEQTTNGDNVLTINNKHPFFKELYERTNSLKNVTIYEFQDITYVIKTFKEIQCLIDVLFMAYAKAENMFENPDELFLNLKESWGINVDNYMKHLIKTNKS